MRREFFATSFTHVLDCRLPSFFRLLPCLKSMPFEGIRLPSHRPILSSMTVDLPGAARVWHPPSGLELGGLSFPSPWESRLISDMCWGKAGVLDKNPNPCWDEVLCIFDAVCFPFAADVVHRFSFLTPLSFPLFLFSNFIFPSSMPPAKHTTVGTQRRRFHTTAFESYCLGRIWSCEEVYNFGYDGSR